MTGKDYINYSNEIFSHYGLHLSNAIYKKGTHVMLGLDPNLSLIPAVFHGETYIETIESYCSFVLQEVHPYVVGVKLQSAFFEIFGAAGIAVLQRLASLVKSLGLLVLLDVKRGDVPSTAAAYAQAYLSRKNTQQSIGAKEKKEQVLSWDVDAITVHPFFGFDTIVPFVEEAKKNGKGIYVCIKTSNLGSVKLQNKKFVNGNELFLEIAQGLKEFHNSLLCVKDEKGVKLKKDDDLSSLGVVTGATFPKEARQIASVLPCSPLLVPGFGAQGGSLEVLDAFRGKATLFPLSRALMYPWLFYNEKNDGEKNTSGFSKKEVSIFLKEAAQKWCNIFSVESYKKKS